MRSALLPLLLLLSVLPARAQNLVPNWSFEEISSCPEEFGQVELATGWLIFRAAQSCELFHACGTVPYASVPGNAFGHQWPATGNGYAGGYSYSASEPWPYVAREYYGIELSQPLIPGQQYHATLKVSRAPEDRSAFSPGGHRYASNNMGLLFSTGFFLQNELDPVPGYAHVRTQQVIEDSLTWTIISGSFIADSAYRYVVVGNFFSDEETDAIVVNPDGYWNLAYYYVDDVCVSPDPLYCQLISGLAETASSSFRVWQGEGGALQLAGLQRSEVAHIVVHDAIGRLVAQQQVRERDSMSLGTLSWTSGAYVVVAHLQHGGRLAERVFLDR